MASDRRWHPEEFGPGGAVIGELFLKLLTQGINELSEPELLVRETAQNSWDARRVALKGSTPMSFRVTDLNGAPAVRDQLKDFFGEAAEFGSGRPSREDPTVLRNLWTSLSRDTTSVLYVRDEGTMGLGGPTNARDAVPDGVVDRYVRFLLNIGQANAEETAGGSYGLGRSVFWRTSSCQTVIVYTRFMEGRLYRSRLIGSSIGAGFRRGGVNHTGRHWWSDGENGQPFEGPKAEEWARRLGFRSYEGDSTGTTVMVIAPSTPGGPRDLATALKMSIEFHLWPKYVTLPGRAPEETMTFAVEHGTEKFEPRNGPDLYGSPLGNHVRAFALGRSKKNESGPLQYSATLEHDFRGFDLRSIGRLSVLKMVPQADVPSAADTVSGIDPEDDPTDLTSVIEERFADVADTIALMRTPELIVGYKRIKNPDNGVALFGVFKATPAANGYLRRSESATHSEWSSTVPQNNDEGKFAKRVAKAFEKKLVEQIEFWFPKPEEDDDDEWDVLDVSELSARFGKLISYLLPGRGNEDDEDDGGDDGGDDGDSGKKKKRLGDSPDVKFIDLEEHNGQLVNVWSVAFVHSGTVKVQFEVLLRLDDNQTEKSAIRKGGRPSILSIEGYVGPEPVGGESTVPNFKKSFPAGRDDENMVMFVQDFPPEESTASGSLICTLKVKALYDEGTTPVLAVSLEKVADKSSKTSGASEVMDQ